MQVFSLKISNLRQKFYASLGIISGMQDIRAFNYFKEYEEGFEDTDWDASYNPIVGYSLSNPADVTKLLSLNNGIVQPTFWDYLSSVTLFGDVISGLVNSSKDKQKY